jgi:ubiquinone/menaquinone biosynthesis C-methylase UbiE
MARPGRTALGTVRAVTTGQPSGFETITEHPRYYVGFLDERTTIAGELMAKRIIMQLLDLHDGQAVLDVGAGTGADAIEVARAVGPTGRVVGVDKSAEMVAEAQGRAVEAGLRVEFAVGDAHSLDFPDGSFDRVRSERMLVHVPDPAAAVREMVRVTKAGGLVVLSDIDGGTIFFNSANTSLADALARRLTDGLANGWMGRRQQRYLVEAGLVDVKVVPNVILNTVAFLRIVCGGLLSAMIADGTTTTDAVDAFWAELEQGERAGWLCSGVVCFSVVGRKPN